MVGWRKPLFKEGYCKECGKKFNNRKKAIEHAEETKHRVVLKYG